MFRALVLTALLASIASLASCSDEPSQLGTGRRTGSSGATKASSGSGGSSEDDGSSGTSSTPSGGGGGATGDGSAADICVATINEYRKGKGLPPYARWSEMESCADGQAESDGSTRRAHGAFGKCGEFAQNECPGWEGPATTMIPQCLKAMYGEGPGGGHYEAMVSTKYTKVSCGFGTASNGAVWSVQNFR